MVRERANQRLQDGFRVGRFSRGRFYRYRQVAQFHREDFRSQIDSNTDDADASRTGFYRFGEDPAKLPLAKQNIVRPFDIGLKGTRLNERVVYGQPGRKGNYGPKSPVN